MTASVQDKQAERGILLNNVLTGLILAAILWVGNSIMQVKDAMSHMMARQEVIVTRIGVAENELNDHEKRMRDCEMARQRYLNEQGKRNGR